MENANLPAEIRPIETITAEIQILKQRAGEDIIGIGQRLIEAKEQLQHGEWLPWLRDEVQFSERSAQQFMRIAKEYSNPQLVADLGVRKALNLLALPESEREEFAAEKHEVNGEEKSVAEMSARELEQAIKELQAVRKELKDAKAKLDDAADEKAGFEEKVAQLNAKIEALENQPKEVSAVEVVKDEEAERKLQAKIVDLQQQLKDSKEKSKELIQIEAHKITKLKEEKEEAVRAGEQKADLLRQQNETLKKQLQTASSGDLSVFKIHFDMAKKNVDDMWEILVRMKKQDKEQFEKLCKAAEGFAQYAKELLTEAIQAE